MMMMVRRRGFVGCHVVNDGKRRMNAVVVAVAVVVLVVIIKI